MNEWSELRDGKQYRISDRRGVKTLWRKQYHEALYGGHQIVCTPFSSKVAAEWLAEYAMGSAKATGE